MLPLPTESIFMFGSRPVSGCVCERTFVVVVDRFYIFGFACVYTRVCLQVVCVCVNENRRFGQMSRETSDMPHESIVFGMKDAGFVIV